MVALGVTKGWQEVMFCSWRLRLTVELVAQKKKVSKHVLCK